MPFWLGDAYSGCTLTSSFTTVTTTGAPTALTGTPAPSLVAWKLVGAWSCSTAGLTLALDCKGATGWNGFSVNTNADAAFYSCGADFAVVVTGGTVGGTCVSYYTIATFSLKNRAALLPVISGRQLEVSAGGNSEQGLACTIWNSLQSSYDTCGTFGVLLDCQVSKVLDQAIAEPSGVFAWATATPKAVLTWLGVIATNKITQTSTTQTVRTRADGATVATSTVSDDGTTATRGSFS